MDWNSPSRKVRKKVQIGIKTYLENEIIEIVVDESIISENTLQFGTVISNRCDVSLKTTDIIPNNSKVIPFICLEKPDGTLTEWIQLGVFYVDDRTADNNIINLTCYDRLFLSGRQYVAYTEIANMDDVRFPISHNMRIVFKDICVILGVTYDNSIAIDALVDFEELPYYGATIRDVLSYIATVHGACCKIDRNGLLTLVTFANKTPVATITRSDYSSCRQTNPYRRITSIEVNYGERRSWSLGGEWVDGEFLSIHSPYLDVSDIELNEMIASRVPLSYTPLSINCRGNPNWRVGDYISVEMKDGRTVQTIILRSTLRIGIGLSQTIESPSETGKESEFGKFNIREEVQTQKEVVDKLSPIVDADDENTFLGYKQNAGLKVGMGVAKSSVTLKHKTPSKVAGQPDKAHGIGVDANGAYVFDETARSPIPQVFISNTEPIATQGKNGDLWIKVGGA